MVTDGDAIQVLIVGAGLGGLALAGVLRQNGVEPVVIEQADAWDDTGYGIALCNSGMGLLGELTIDDGIRDVGNPVDAWALRGPDGAVLERTVTDSDRDVSPFVVVHRAELHEQLRRLVPDTSVRMDTTLGSITQTPDGAHVTFSDGVREQFDVIVGADGVRSHVRRLIGGDGEEFCGTTNWAFRVPSHIETPDEFTESWGLDGTAFMSMPLDDHDVVWLAAPADEGDFDEFTIDSLREVFDELEWLLPDILDAVDVEDVWHDDNYRVRTDVWTEGRVALLGDAAHALHPISGLGASLAFEDAFVLADELLHRDDDVGIRLADYAGRRRSRIRKLRWNARLAPAFAFPESPLLATIRDAIALRSTMLETLFGGRSRPSNGSLADP